MLTRINRKAQEKDSGFTLIELLVVIIIIGILSAIAIPLFLNQQKKAQDSAAKADVSVIGKEIATWMVDATATDKLELTSTATDYTINTKKIGNRSNNVALGAAKYEFTTANRENWCVLVKNAEGDKANDPGFSYSAAEGLQNKACS